MIEIAHLSKHFGPLKAVDDVSFSVERGTVLGFLGPNGAGKSTTMKMITGFLTPDAGTVKVGGDDIASQPIQVKQRIGYLPEGAPLYGDMTPQSFLGFIAEIRGYKGAERTRAINDVCEKVSLGAVFNRPIETLSKGFKRRVGLAQAILHDPPVLILDEPTDGLDPNQKHEVRNLIRSMAAEKVIVLSTHILEEVDAVCDRAIIIASGRIVSDGTPGELQAQSAQHNAVAVSMRGAGGPHIANIVGALPGVSRVEVLEQHEDRARLQVFPVNDTKLVGAVSNMARERGWEIEEIYIERGRLDDVFRDVTTQASQAATK